MWRSSTVTVPRVAWVITAAAMLSTGCFAQMAAAQAPPAAAAAPAADLPPHAQRMKLAEHAIGINIAFYEACPCPRRRLMRPAWHTQHTQHTHVIVTTASCLPLTV